MTRRHCIITGFAALVFVLAASLVIRNYSADAARGPPPQLLELASINQLQGIAPISLGPITDEIGRYGRAPAAVPGQENPGSRTARIRRGPGAGP